MKDQNSMSAIKLIRLKIKFPSERKRTRKGVDLSGWDVGRILEELREVNPQSEHIVWKKIHFQLKTEFPI